MSELPPSGPTGVSASQHAPPDGGDSWWGFFRFLAQRVFVYFALYALSIGPFYWQWYGSQFVGGSGVLAAFYLPLVKLAEWIPPFGAWMDWYIGFWIA